MPRNTRKAAQRIFQAKETVIIQNQINREAEEKGIYEQYDTDRRWIENKQASSSYSEVSMSDSFTSNDTLNEQYIDNRYRNLSNRMEDKNYNKDNLNNAIMGTFGRQEAESMALDGNSTQVKSDSILKNIINERG
ncbi:6060_t:CDS:2 [Rhizophagus irregularis]|nr:6060_t:CDS:2 [Rhizophagus irregularis]